MTRPVPRCPRCRESTAERGYCVNCGWNLADKRVTNALVVVLCFLGGVALLILSAVVRGCA